MRSIASKHVIALANLLTAIMTRFVGLVLFVMLIAVAIQVVVRLVLPPLGVYLSVPWTDELARYLLVWCIFIGAACATRSRDLISVEFFLNALPPGWERGVRMSAYAMLTGFYVLLVVLGIQWMRFGLQETSIVMRIPNVWIYAAMPVGAVLSILNLLARILDQAAKRPSGTQAPIAAR